MSLFALIEKQKAQLRELLEVGICAKPVLLEAFLASVCYDIAETLYREIRPEEDNTEDADEYERADRISRNACIKELDRRFKSYCEKV